MFTDVKICLRKHFASVTLFIYKEITQINLGRGVTESRQAERAYPSGGLITLTVIQTLISLASVAFETRKKCLRQLIIPPCINYHVK